jgi:cupin 2 domain-containing protein
MNKNNLFENLPDTCTAEIFETLLENKNLKIERIVSDGQATPPGQWYDQGWDEWVVLLQGNAGILFEEDHAPVVLKPGDNLFIPTHKIHRVEWTDPKQKTIWLVIHIKTSEK